MSKVINLLGIIDYQSFPDAKPAENFAKDFVGADFAGDGAKQRECFAKVLREKVCGDAGIKSRRYFPKGVGTFLQGLGVSCICHQNLFGIGDMACLDERFFQFFYAGTLLCTDR